MFKTDGFDRMRFERSSYDRNCSCISACRPVPAMSGPADDQEAFSFVAAQPIPPKRILARRRCSLCRSLLVLRPRVQAFRFDVSLPSLAGTATSIIFVATKVRDKTRLLSRQKYACRDKHKLTFVATNTCLSRQKYASRDKNVCVFRDKTLSLQK